MARYLNETEAGRLPIAVKPDGSGEAVLLLSDPMRSLPPDAFEPVAYRVDAGALACLVETSGGGE